MIAILMTTYTQANKCKTITHKKLKGLRKMLILSCTKDQSVTILQQEMSHHY